MREAMEIDPKWLTELAPDFYQDQRKEMAILGHQKEVES